MTNRELTRAALRAEEGMWQGFAAEERIKREQENHEMTERDDALVEQQVSDAMWDVLGVAAWESNGTITITEDDWDAMITAAIAAVEQSVYARLTSEGAVEAMLDAANSAGHLFPKRDYNNLPSYSDFHEQRLRVCRSIGQAALAHCGIGAGKEDGDAK